jgi:hypothetical protein
VGKPRVDLLQLLEALRDTQTGSVEETILTGIAANALDSGATRISIRPNTADATLTVVDDGRGITRRDLTRYHAIIRSGKRAESAGFAGIGIKFALLLADEVVTETWRGNTHVATTWRLATRYRAPWKWIPPPGLIDARGTAVRLRLANPLSPLLDRGFLEEAMRTHFAPLVDPAFTDLLRRQYPDGIRIDVDGVTLAASHPPLRDRVTIPIRMGRRRLPSATVVLQHHQHPLNDDHQGIAISTLGKVIKRGWDWVGLSPASAWRVSGLVEVPELAACLEPDRTDFIRTGRRSATYVAYRKAIQAVVSRQLAAWGESSEGEPRPRALRLERDLERVLMSLAGEFPRLASLVDARPAEQKRLPMHGRGEEPHAPRPPVRCELLLQFESRPHDPEPGRLADGTIWINDAHPAYTRATASRSMGYHIALTVALALAPLAVDAQEVHAFVTRFLAQWGTAGTSTGRRTRR